MGHPGPEGFVVGRVALPGSWDAVGSVCSLLRAQLVLNNLSAAAYSPSALRTAEANQQVGTSGQEQEQDAEMVDLAELEGGESLAGTRGL